MKYQPKVNKTRNYSDNQGEHIVCEGKLFLIETKEEKDITSPHALWASNDNGLFMNPYDNPFELLKEYNLLKPIIISETEEIEEGDWVYHSEDDLFQDIYKGITDKDALKNWNGNQSVYKILALPEHFSDKHLQAIVDGKMEEGKVLVKTTQMVKQHDSHNKSFYRVINLNQQNHITLFPAKQSLEEAANEWKNDRYHYVGGSCFDTWDIKAAFKAGAEWAKKNSP